MEEKLQIDFMQYLSPVFSIIMVVTVIISWLTGTSIDRWHKKNQLYVLITALIIPMEICFLISIPLPGQTRDDFYCLDNAVGREQRDGFSACVAQGIFLFYFTLIMSFAWMFQCMEIMFQLVFKWKLCTKRLGIELVVTIGTPTVCTAFSVARGHYGFAGGLSLCHFTNNVSVADSTLLFFLPGAATCIIGLVCVCLVFGKIISTIFQVHGGIIGQLMTQVGVAGPQPGAESRQGGGAGRKSSSSGDLG